MYKFNPMRGGLMAFAGQQHAQRWYDVSAKSEGRAEIYIYDEIGMFGVSAKDFISDLNALTAGEIVLRINSPGGSVFDGMAIYNALKRHPAKVTTVIDGAALSMASIIALAGDEVLMVENGIYMIHNAWTYAVGDADELRKIAAMLDRLDQSGNKIYADKTGLDLDVVSKMVADETWMSADQALSHGFVDRVLDPSDTVFAKFDPRAFNNVPDALKTPAPASDKLEPVCDDVLLDESGESEVSSTQLRARARLRLAEVQALATAR